MRHRIIGLVATATLALGLVAAGGSAALANDDDHDHCPPPWVPPTLVLGSFGDDRLVGTDCDDLILGLTGNDRLIGRFGEDTLRGGPGNDVLRAVDGERDVVSGGGGFDRCVGDVLGDQFLRCEVVIEVLIGG